MKQFSKQFGKNARRLVVVGFALILVFSLVACSKKTVVGTWVSEDQSQTYVMNSDGTGSVKLSSGISLSMTYTTTDSKITVNMTYLGQTETDEYTYTLKDNKLTLTKDNTSVTYTKQ
jgi:predicted Zn-dependent protease